MPKGKKKEEPIIEDDALVEEGATEGAVADEILLNGNCKLTTYFESSNYHKVFLKGILDVYNKVTGEMHDRCPIT